MNTLVSVLHIDFEIFEGFGKNFDTNATGARVAFAVPVCPLPTRDSGNAVLAFQNIETRSK